MATKSICSVIAAALACLPTASTAQTQHTTQRPTPPASDSDRITPGVFLGDVRDLPIVELPNPSWPVRQVPGRITHWNNLISPPQTVNPTTWKLDPLLALQEAVGKTAPAAGFGITNLNIPGHRYTNATVPDTVGDVGPTYYIQMVNSLFGSSFTIFRKSDGRRVAGPNTLDSLAPSGFCTDGDGDPSSCTIHWHKDG